MRICLVSILALLMPVNFPAGRDPEKKEVNNHIRLKGTSNKNSAKNGKKRVFHTKFQIVVEESDLVLDLNGARLQTERGTTGEYTVFEAQVGKITENDKGDTLVVGTLPCKMSGRIEATADILDGKSVDCGRLRVSDREKTEEAELYFMVKVESVDNSRVRFVVVTKQNRIHNVSGEFTRSWDVRLQAAKIVKLGEKTKLDLSGESLLGIKATCEGVIEEIVKD